LVCFVVYGSLLNYLGEYGNGYSLCSSASLWLGQCIAVHHKGEMIQRICNSKFTRAK